MKWVGAWYSGIVISVRHCDDGLYKHRVQYDDGDCRDHVLSEKAWEIVNIM